MSDNPYHKPAGTYTPEVVIPISDLTPQQRLLLMFGKMDEKKPYTTLNAVATNGCQANIARPL